MDNPETKDGSKSLGLFQESYMPVTLHVDTGFDFEKIIYKQTLLALSEVGETVIFKNRYYEGSTNFTQDPKELGKKDLKYGQNKRSDVHLKMYGNKPFDEKIHQEYLQHEDINNLKGLQVELIFKWKLGDLLIFDRTNHSVKPAPGKLVIWPGHLSHTVPEQTCDHDRIAISGNLQVVVKEKQ